MYINMRSKISILIISTIIFSIFILFETSNSENINYRVESIKLSIYGQNEIPYEYYTTKQKSINYIVSKINSISLHNDNKIAKINEFNLPKTTKYVLEISGKKLSKYTFVNNYVLYNNYIYRVNNCNSIINSIEEEIRKAVN
ncbi:hypothetical protein F300043A5_08620 [Massilimicrobiota timonensis]|uniref:hypothetical protein n=1 Tax=Massilimicrobiota timonensis TaxID=1776392 RepID=UPI0036F1F0F7